MYDLLLVVRGPAASLIAGLPRAVAEGRWTQGLLRFRANAVQAGNAEMRLPRGFQA